jgi:hypothetical protein
MTTFFVCRVQQWLSTELTENQLDAVRYLFLVLIEFWVIVHRERMMCTWTFRVYIVRMN